MKIRHLSLSLLLAVILVLLSVMSATAHDTRLTSAEGTSEVSQAVDPVCYQGTVESCLVEYAGIFPPPNQHSRLLRFCQRMATRQCGN